MKRRNFLKGLVVTPAIIAGCKAVTMPGDKLIPPAKTRSSIKEGVKMKVVWNDEILNKFYEERK